MDPVLVIGAGISGLTCAHALQRRGIDVVVIEAGDRVGGVIQSERVGGFLVERGPNSLLPTAHTYTVLDQLGLRRSLLEADRSAPRYVVIKRKLRKFPFAALTVGGILRILKEPFVRSRSSEDESVAAFVRRRFGEQAYQRLAAAFIGGIYAGDAEKLSVAAAFPKFVDLEREHGSILGGAIRSLKKGGPPRGRVSSFPDGLETLPHRLAAGLRIELNASNVRIGRSAQAPATVIATPAFAAAEIVQPHDWELADLLRRVEYAPVVVAASTIRGDPATLPRGFGFLAPPSERLTVLGTLFTSSLFPDRAPEGRALLTSYIGGALKPEAYDWPDTRLWDLVAPELKEVLNLASAPEPVALFRHRRAIPQYPIGHQRWRRQLEEQLRRSAGLFITGNYIDGISVPGAMEHAEKTAQAVVEFLEKKQ